MNSKIAVLFWILLTAPSVGYAVESVESKAAAHVSNFLYATLYEELDARLRQSGLPEENIEETAERAARSYAKCVVDALLNDANPESKVLLKKLADGASGDDLQETFADSTKANVEVIMAQLESVITPCWMTTNQELGIVD